MRPFRHPLHTAIVHFPIASWVLAASCDGAWLFINPAPFFLKAALWLQGIGLVTASAAVIAGVMDLEGLKTRPKAATTIIANIVLMASAASAAAVSFMGRFKTPIEDGVLWPLFASFAAALLVLAGAYFGGELVYRHGFGRIEE